MKINIEDYVKERNEALFSLDEAKIRAFMRKYNVRFPAANNKIVFWAGIYKSICNIPSAPEDVRKQASEWLKNHNMSEEIS